MQSAPGEQNARSSDKKVNTRSAFMERNAILRGAALANQICAKTHTR